MPNWTPVKPSNVLVEQANASDEVTKHQCKQIDDTEPLLARFMAVETDDSLAKRVREVIAGNGSKAAKTQ